LETSLERIDGHTVRLTVTVPAEEVDKAIDEAYKRVAKKVKVPGFRAGKAPKPIIDTHVGRDAVISDAQDEVLAESYSKALDAEGLRPVQQPEIDDIEVLEPGKPFEYVAEVIVRPELTLSSIEGLEVDLPSARATDAEVDAQIEHFRDRFATLEPVEDRSIAEDDFVLLSFVGKIDGEEYEGNTVDKYLYEMGRGLMPDEFEQALVGAKAGEQVNAEYVIPETSSNPDFVGKPATFEVTIHEVKAKVLPEVDADFAMNVGGFESVDDLRDSIREQLDRTKSLGRARAREREARRALAQRLEGDVPQQMVDATREQIKRDFVSSLQSREMTLEQYMQVTETDMEQLEADFTQQAEDAVREELALEALFRRLGYEITEDDVTEAVKEMAGASEADPEELRVKWEAAGVMPVLHEQIMHKRAIAWLMDDTNVGINESEETAGEAEAQAETEPATDADAEAATEPEADTEAEADTELDEEE